MYPVHRYSLEIPSQFSEILVQFSFHNLQLSVSEHVACSCRTVLTFFIFNFLELFYSRSFEFLRMYKLKYTFMVMAKFFYKSLYFFGVNWTNWTVFSAPSSSLFVHRLLRYSFIEDTDLFLQSS